MRIAWNFTVLLLLFVWQLSAQPAFEPVKGLATKEVYDLLLDHKGFLWVGHELGLSRLNNGTFENFSNPQQASLSVTNLLEDNQGRIWCHNFSGQIFYVENGKMHLLGAYDIKREHVFPSMAICGDELVATSAQGLFICNTNNLSTRYIPYHFSDVGITLTSYKNAVVIYDGINWFIYREHQGISKVEGPKPDTAESAFTLVSSVMQDTMYMIRNPAGVIVTAVLNNNQIKVVGRHYSESFINGINDDHGKLWIHTKAKSFVLNDTLPPIEGRNLTHIITDRQGNTWYSSLNMGLSVKNQALSWKRVDGLWAGNGDIVRVIDNFQNQIVYGTQQGIVRFIDQRSGHILRQLRLPLTSGGIEFLRHFGDKLFIGTSTSLYCYLPESGRLLKLAPYLAKDIDTLGDKFLVAMSATLLIRPLTIQKDSSQWLGVYKKAYPTFNVSYNMDLELNLPKRCKAVRLEKSQVIAAALLDGLVEIDHKSLRRVLFNGLPIYSSSLEYIDDRLFIATLGNGLLIKTGTTIESLNTSTGGLFSNSIIRMKHIGRHLWLFEDKYVQILDLGTRRIMAPVMLPPIAGAEVYDISEINGNAYVSTKDGMYEVKMNGSLMQAPNCYIDGILVNQKDTLGPQGERLDYTQNNITFFLSTSWFSSQSPAVFRYRVSENSNGWETLSPGGSTVQLASLMPGDYTFQAFAEAGNGNRSPITSFHFSIRKPWWYAWWFWLLVGVCAGAMIYGLYRYRIQQLLRVENMRRKLSSDLHDNIGATLSCVNIYAELSKEEGTDEYADMIQSLSNEAIQQLRDMVWTINPKNDSYEKLVNRMHAFAATFFKASDMRYNFTYDEGLFEFPLDLHKRQNLYYIFKELVNNVVRHSEASTCLIEFRCDRNFIYLRVNDNGKGFPVESSSGSGNGINNILQRTEEMKGRVIIDSKPENGTSVDIRVPV